MRTTLIFARPSYWLTLVVTLLLLPPCVSAELITPDLARQKAVSFLRREKIEPRQIIDKNGDRMTIPTPAENAEIDSSLAILVEGHDTLAYVLSLAPKGFVIVAANDEHGEVLGFSYSSNFISVHDTSQVLLDLLRADVDARRRLGSCALPMPSESSALAQWGPWLQTTWVQGPPFNAQCPWTNVGQPGSRRAVGCVATAMAQIVNYWKFPTSVDFGAADSFQISGVEFDLTAAHTAGWGTPSLFDMQGMMSSLLYDGNLTEAGNLSFAAGVKLRMNYTRDSGSVASTYSVRRALTNEFGFGSGSAFAGSDCWTNHSGDVIGNLKEGWPCQIGIARTGRTIGHSIVVDGYRDTDGFFHLNCFPSAKSGPIVGFC